MLQKQSVNVNFAQGLDTKTDPYQVPIGKFLSLQNSIFDKAGRLTKRNGYKALTPLPDVNSSFLTTFQGNLTALGMEVQAYSQPTNTWVTKGNLQPLELSTLPLVRSNTNQIQADSVIAPNGLICTAFTDAVPVSGSLTTEFKYQIADSVTGQNIIPPTLLVNADPTYGTPRVFLLGNYFIIVYTTLVSATDHLVYIAISTYNPTIVTAPQDIANSYAPSTHLSFDGVVTGNKLFIAYHTNTGGTAVKATYITSALGAPVTGTTFAGFTADLFCMSVDSAIAGNPRIYISFYDSGSQNGYTWIVDQNINTVLGPTLFTSGVAIVNMTSVARNQVATIFYEVTNAYGYDSSIPTNYIQYRNITQGAVVGPVSTLARSVGLASKAFLYAGAPYMLAIYYSLFQPTYFLLNQFGQVISKLAYSNAGNYLTFGLPNITVLNSIMHTNYIVKDLIQAVNKTQGLVNAAGIYAQTGVNLANFEFSPVSITSAEIGGTLNISGGILSSYDGFEPVEQGFFLWPDNVEATITGSGGNISQQQYFYQFTYEWADNQGNIYRSAPSIPLSVNVTTGAGSATVTLHVPTLRLTYKILNPVKIVGYRWSTAQQNYYEFTSILLPSLNNPTVDYIDITDTSSDASILGNALIYTTGGVLEDIAPPATNLVTLFNNRLWMVDAEDTNLLWYSKQVIEATPVEMSDLLTLFVAPTTGSQGSTGPITAISPMDDKLIIYKTNALGYINGIGPDNTGANNQYSDFILINSVVGCTNQQSIVFTPAGLMFQSSKGIWLLGRDLSTSYIGAPVEVLTTGAIVESAVNIPNTNQVRFTLDSGITLMYDYYYGQWGTFTNVPATSSTLYQNLHTYMNSFGQVFQESPGIYLDNTSPVLMSFTSNWMNLAGLQGFERFYQMYLLGTYLSPFKLNVQLAYNYDSSIQQYTMVSPITPGSNWGGEQLWGSGQQFGGPSNVFEARVFPQIQKCESFQITINEIFDRSLGLSPGAGLTLSGMDLVIGMKRGFRTSSASRNFG